MRFYKSPIGRCLPNSLLKVYYDPHIATIFRERFLVSRQNAVRSYVAAGI
ncbi:hypothetical protein QUF88_02130 [Bacillus sp. DX1.1]|nr:hypothetical protein [Bacillus sp. DX1.1]MDM5152774.1 hypothetical protein [Bacillus sp. DX1.1]